MIKDEIEEDKIDLETSVPLPTYNCTEELNERFITEAYVGLIIFIESAALFMADKL